MSASRQKKLRKEQQNNNVAAASEKKGTSKGLKTFLCVLIVAIVLVAFVYFALRIHDFFPAHLTAATVGTQEVTETVEGQEPTVNITSGHELTGAQIAYWLLDTYAEEQAYLGTLVDTTVPLHEQDCPEEGFDTWYDYMLDLAMTKAASTYTVYDEAVAAGMTLSENGKATVAQQLEMIQSYVDMGMVVDADTFLTLNYGEGCTVDSYEDYLTVNTLAQEYVTSKYSEMKYEQADIDAYHEEHADEIDMVRFRVFELLAETTTDENGETVVTEDALAAAEVAAIAMADDSKGNEEKFLELAKANTAEALRENYDADVNTAKPDTKMNQLTDELRAWFTDDMRSIGDTQLTENEDGTGFYVYFNLGPVDMSVKLPSVRHILIQPEKDEEGNISDEAWIAAEEQAKALLEQYRAGEQSDEAFAALADANSSDTGSVGKGGLYENIIPRQMVPAFDEWCFDTARQPGDTDVVKTDYGYHVMYFKGMSDDSYLNLAITNLKRSEDLASWQEEIEAKVAYVIEDTQYIPVI